MTEKDSGEYQTTKRLGFAILLIYGIANIPYIIKSYYTQKGEEVLRLQEKYVQGLEKSLTTRQPVWCTEEKTELQHWCEDNKRVYSLGKYFVDYLSTIEQWCIEAKQNKQDFQEQLDLFFEKIDTNKELRIALEQTIYSCEDEIGIDVLKNPSGEYEFLSYSDPSDPIYNAYLDMMRRDPPLQQYLWSIVDGEEKEIPKFRDRVEQLVNDAVHFETLERGVLNSIEEKLLSAEIYEDLGKVAQSSQEHHQFIDHVDSLMGKYANRMEECQKALSKLSTEVPEEELSLLRQLKKDYGELLQERQDFEKRWNDNNEEYIANFWADMKKVLIQYKFDQMVPVENTLSPSLLAFGHTHPNFYEQEEEGEEHGPSEIDMRNSRRRPELVFTTLPDRWQIHTIICGESALAREYRRTQNVLSIPETFLNMPYK